MSSRYVYLAHLIVHYLIESKSFSLQDAMRQRQRELMFRWLRVRPVRPPRCPESPIPSDSSESSADSWKPYVSIREWQRLEEEEGMLFPFLFVFRRIFLYANQAFVLYICAFLPFSHPAERGGRRRFVVEYQRRRKNPSLGRT